MRSIVVGCVLAVACGRVHFDVRGDSALIDAADIDAADAAMGSGPFGPPMQVTELDSALFDDDIVLSKDQLEIMFSRATTTTAPGDLFRATRTDVSLPWSSPVAVTELNTTSHESGPTLSPDELTLLFVSTRAGASGSYDFWYATRATRQDPWVVQGPVGELNTATLAETTPKQDANGTRMVYCTMNTSIALVSSDLWETSRSDIAQPWEPPTMISELNTTSGECAPVLADGGLTIYFYSIRAGGPGGGDIYRAVRSSVQQPFAAPTLVDEINTPGREEDPWLSPDGHFLYFVRDGAIYMASR